MPSTLLGELLIGTLGTDPPFGPCRWPVNWSCCQLADGTPLDQQETLVDAAVELAWALSGRQFGQCAVTIRPCAATCADSCDHGWDYSGWRSWQYPYPAKIDGVWMNLACSCGSGCECSHVERVILPEPVTHIAAVVIDGVTLDTSAYRVDNRRLLVRQDGGRWPRCQDLGKPAGEPGTWTVEAYYGREVPLLGQLAVAELACEFQKLCSGADCQIPPNWSTISRQGITIQQDITDGDLDVLPEQWLPWTRRFLASYNPTRLTRRSRVISPDVPRPTRTF